MAASAHDGFLRRMAPLLDIAWRKYRRRQSHRGLQRRLAARGVDLAEYAEILARDAAERERLVLAMRVTVSRFYRDPPVWGDLARVVLPDLLQRLGEDETLRVWSAGCACGEEPYSIAILWSRLPLSVRQGRRLQVLATDVDEEALGRGRDGIYPRSSVRQVPAPREDVLQSVLAEPARPHRVRVREALRGVVRFARHDLLEDPPPEGMHLVLCRYLAFTYYRGERLRRATRALASALDEGGALVVGAKESMAETGTLLFEPWPNVRCVYRKSVGVRRS